MFQPRFNIGDIVTHDEIVSEFSCGNMGGMRKSIANNCLLIISDHTKGLYDDKWYGDTLHYTGMGKIGNQDINHSQNRTLAESNSNGIAVYLFEVLIAKQYIFRGQVKLVEEPYKEIQADDEGNDRFVWMFPVRTVIDSSTDLSVIKKYEANRDKSISKIDTDRLSKLAKANQSTQVSSRITTSTTYVRDPYVSELAKREANGICQLCEKPAPFCDSNGKPYLESHHIEWLSKGGSDTIENTVALCPNCHKKMHVVNDKNDLVRLTIKVNRKIIGIEV